MIRHFMMTAAAALLLAGCTGDKTAPDNSSNVVTDTAQALQSDRATAAQLSDIIASQPEDVRLRYGARNPQKTLEFFGLEPDMTVIEVLPGGGWYTKIISPYLGLDGHLIGVDYSLDMWPEFGGFATPEFIAARQNWAESWTQDMTGGLPSKASALSAYTLTTLPSEQDGQVDMVLLIRAMHNLARFNETGGYLDNALNQLNKSLKPGGIVGIVQHAAPEENDDSWADGNNGYLKKSYVMAAMKKAGFELVSESDLNENPRDIPSNTDNVWRLPPTLGTSKDDEELRSRMEAIGESNRMTLKFIKPK